MTQIWLSGLPGIASQSSRAPAEPPAAPAPSAPPAMVARVEWAGAVRPADGPVRALRPDLLPKADGDVPTGPPPAFAANMLDLLPDSMMPPDDGDSAAAESGRDGAVQPPDPGPEDGAPGQGPSTMGGPRSGR